MIDTPTPGAKELAGNLTMIAPCPISSVERLFDAKDRTPALDSVFDDSCWPSQGPEAASFWGRVEATGRATSIAILYSGSLVGAIFCRLVSDLAVEVVFALRAFDEAWATEAVRVASLDMFHAGIPMGAARVQTRVLSSNQALIDLLRTCGWVIEGIQKNAARRRGALEDVFMLAFTRECLGKERLQ